MKKLLITTGILLAIVITATIILNNQVSGSTAKFLYNDPDNIPVNKVGVILGTSKYLSNGKINEYWKNRIDAALILYKHGKVRNFIISGDNSTKNYDEPTDMKNELVRLGVPDSVIYLDYAGFRTFDSMIRTYRIFGQSSFTVISQEFHNQRAVFIARHYGINAVGFNAKNVTAYNGFKTNLREKFARVKLFIDLLFDKQPKFLGERIKIK